MPFGVLRGVSDVIISAKFCVSRLSGFSAAVTPKSVISLQQFRTMVQTVHDNIFGRQK